MQALHDHLGAEGEGGGDDVDDEGLDSGVGSVFLPLQRCNKRKARDPVVVDEDSAEFGGFRGIKASNKAEAVLGEF